jgi:uncharacterized protein (DUF1015 family)
MDIHQRLALLGIAIPELLIPKAGTDLQKWAVIACDQFTQDYAYWEAVKNLAGAAPSTLNLILPEIFLAESCGRGIAAIHDAMSAYLAQGTLVPCERGAVYIERKTSFHERRRGLVICVDLEQYDWKPESRPLIRSTEGTVEERLPPRMAIRRNAALETSHILLLIDDKDDAVLSALGERAKQEKPLYKTELSMEGGAVSGWLVRKESDWAYLAEALEGLAAISGNRYGGASEAPFLFAVGDGNHSLASAKAIWLEYKAAHSGEEGLAKHPARYALVEIENLYDAGIAFEPIHRIIFGASLDRVEAALAALPAFSSRTVSSREELAALVGGAESGQNRFGLVSADSYLLVESEHRGLATDTLQPLLDTFVADSTAYSIDYIHGADSLFQTAREGAVGLLLPPIDKRDLFKTIARRGPLPRKSFSMGEAREKRFYLECRKLF